MSAQCLSLDNTTVFMIKDNNGTGRALFVSCFLRFGLFFLQGEGLPSVTSVAFSSDGSSLFAASSGKEVVEWNVETGTVARKLK